MYRCYLDITTNGVTSTLDVTDELVNWADVDLSFKRQDYDGVMRAFSTSFNFCGNAYKQLVALFINDGFNADAMVRFELRDNYVWSEIFRCALDFSTFKYDALTCEINAVDNSIAALIKANKSTKYQYNVSDLALAKKLRYDRLDMISRINWFLNMSIDDDDVTRRLVFVPLSANNDFAMPFYVESSEIAVPDTCEPNDVEWASTTYGNYKALPSFFKSLQARTVHVKMTFLVHLDYFTTNDTEAKLIVAKRHTAPDGTVTMTDIYTHDLYANRVPTIFNCNSDVAMDENDELLFVLRYKLTIGQRYELVVNNIGDMYVSYIARGEAVDCDIIDIEDLLSAIVTSICGNSVTSEITGLLQDDRLAHTYIMAADSARALPGSKLYTSFDDFSRMMSAEFGFVPVIDEANAKVSFIHRSKLFGYGSAHNFTRDEFRDFQLTVQQSLLFSSVNVGYDKQDYDSVNGRDEFRFTDQYATGLTGTDNTLDLISPYRADAYGIEFLVIKRGENTTDNKSDEDVFLVDCDLMDEDVYKLRRGFDVEADSVDTGHYVKTDGTIGSKADSRIYTYSVTPGEVVRAYVVEMGQPLGASASIVSLWNGGTFVEDVRSGDIRLPITIVDIEVPSGVTAVKLSCSTDGRYSVSLSKSTIQGVISPGTMFNERYAQMYMVEANKRYLSGLCALLTPTSVEGNADVIIDGKSVMDAITLDGEALFLPQEITITTPITAYSLDWQNVFTLAVGGYGYTCYLKDVRIAVGMEQAVTYTLLVAAVGV